MSVRIGKVTVWGPAADELPVGVCRRLVVEGGNIRFGVWMRVGLAEARGKIGSVYHRDPRYRSPVVSRKST